VKQDKGTRSLTHKKAKKRDLFFLKKFLLNKKLDKKWLKTRQSVNLFETLYLKRKLKTSKRVFT
jgi:hypothetical protein